MCYVSSEITIRGNMGHCGSQNAAEVVAGASIQILARRIISSNKDRKLKCSHAKTLRQMHDGVSMLTLMRTSKQFIIHDYALKLFS